MEKIVFIVGRVFQNGAWEVLGVYEQEDEAVKRCKTPNDFVGPIAMNEDMPEEKTAWTNSYYPIKPITAL